MLIGWLQKAESCDFSEELVSLTLTGNYGKMLSGQGSIVWNEDGVSLKALTDGAKELQGSMFSPPKIKAGELLSDEFYFRLEATTQSGQTLVVDRVMPNGFSIHSNSEYASWNFGSHDLGIPIRITGSLGHEKLSGTIEFFLFPNNVDRYPRPSETVHENPVFGFGSSNFDWLQFTCALGKVSAQRRPSGAIHFRIKNTKPIGVAELQAIQTAFCFLTGRFSNFRAVEIRWADKTERLFGWPLANSTRNRLSPPLGLASRSSHMYETCLSIVTDYFLTTRGEEVAGLVYACQDSVDNSFTTHAMVVCASVEALLKPYAKKLEVSSGLSSEDKKSIVEFCKKQKFKENVVNRLEGFMNGMESPSVDQVMRNWIDEGFIGVVKEDHKAWKSLRNDVMHGKRVLFNTTKKKTQKRMDSVDRLRNLFNKIILHEAGYVGQYRDYALHQDLMFGSAGSNDKLEETVKGLSTVDKGESLSDDDLLVHLRRVGMASFATHFEAYKCYADGKAPMDKSIGGATRRFGNAKVIFAADREQDALRLVANSTRVARDATKRAKALLASTEKATNNNR